MSQSAERNGEVPEGWTIASLGDGLIESIQLGFACGAHTRVGSGTVPHLRPMNVSVGGMIDLTDLKFVPESEVDGDARWLRRGDVLFNNTNSPALVGKTAFYDDPTPRAFSNHMTRLRCRNGALDPQYCALALHSKWHGGLFETICNNHVSQASISRSVLLNTLIALPPLAEQRRIVAKVVALLAKVNTARQSLARIPVTLRRFRQAVLDAACNGKLTANWRKATNRTKSSINSSGIESTLDAPFALPANWNWCSLESLCAEIVDCPHSTPKWTQTGVICLRTTNFRRAGLDLSEPSFVSDEAFRERTKRLIPVPGDIVYSREGGILGIACLIPEGLHACLGQRMMLMRCTPNAYTPALLAYILNSPFINSRVVDLTGGTASPHLNVGDVRKFPIPVPPFAEQCEIVRRVDSLFKLAADIEAKIAVATARADQLMKAILAKAFRGELIPTEAELARFEGRDYEPATVLLDRIRAEMKSDQVGLRRTYRRRYVVD